VSLATLLQANPSLIHARDGGAFACCIPLIVPQTKIRRYIALQLLARQSAARCSSQPAPVSMR
jgi:hypothetical protein